MDWDLGGIYRDGARGGQAIVFEKEFWQNAESLVGFLDGYEQFGDPKYLQAFVKIWQFAKNFMIVDGVGEWRMLVDKHGKPIVTDLANEWKVAYHTGRAMLECNKRLVQLIASAEK